MVVDSPYVAAPDGLVLERFVAAVRGGSAKTGSCCVGEAAGS
jgi:hypothetical protein